MDLTLFLTEDCNLRCRYCYHKRSPRVMDGGALRAALRLGAAEGASTAVSFYGGEPLLCRERILEALDFCRRLGRETGRRFTFQTTTNGILLDEPFLQEARKNGLLIALSHDGLAQDENRVAAGGGGTAALLRETIPLLLRYLPDAPVTMTVAPGCAGLLAESVRRFVEEDGFRHVIFDPAFGPDILWTEAALETLAEQYRLLAERYAAWHRQGRTVRLVPFEAKIDAYIRGEPVCAQTCAMGVRRVSVAADGGLYPCIQFVGDPAFRIGDVHTGIDAAARDRIRRSAGPAPAECRACAFRDRCRHACGCLNRLTGGSPSRPGGALCAHERLLIRAADALAERLYREGDRRFLCRHYARPPQAPS